LTQNLKIQETLVPDLFYSISNMSSVRGFIQKEFVYSGKMRGASDALWHCMGEQLNAHAPPTYSWMRQ